MDWDILPPPNNWVRVIRKAADGELSGMNDFMKDEVRHHFYGKHLKDGCRIPRGNGEGCR